MTRLRASCRRGRELTSSRDVHCLRSIALATICVLGLPSATLAQSSPQPFAPYDGSNPFVCELQDVGTGTDYPDPDADPLCARFDKTNQNVTGFGMVEFLSQEPARVAAASDKCFYFQSDHWQGSIVQGSQPELWHWVGNYFFDRAKGIGGVSAVDARIGNQPMQGAQYAPPEYRPYFAESGGGGAYLQLESKPDPTCLAKVDTPEERARVYRDAAGFGNCIAPGGGLRGRRVGAVRLGMTADEVRAALGEPKSRRGGVERWCVIGNAALWVSYAKAGSGVLRAALVRTTSRGHTVDRVGRGAASRRAIRKLDLEPRFKLGATRVYEAPFRGPDLYAGIRGPKLRWLAIADPALLPTAAAVRRALSRGG